MFDRLVMPIYIIDRKIPETPGESVTHAAHGLETWCADQDISFKHCLGNAKSCYSLVLFNNICCPYYILIYTLL